MWTSHNLSFSIPQPLTLSTEQPPKPTEDVDMPETARDPYLSVDRGFEFE